MNHWSRAAVFCGLAALFFTAWSCAAVFQVPLNHNFKAPEISLDRIEIEHYWGWWYFPATMKPGYGDAGDYGAPLALAVVLEIHNPNYFPVQLNRLNFTLAFEELDLYTVQMAEPQWIPPGKTNQLRVNAVFDARQALLNLMVSGKDSPMAGPTGAFSRVEGWWRGIRDFTFPLYIREGSAVFTAGYITKGAGFEGSYP